MFHIFGPYLVSRSSLKELKISQRREKRYSMQNEWVWGDDSLCSPFSFVSRDHSSNCQLGKYDDSKYCEVNET